MSSSRHINIGATGETPKKIAIFNRDDEPSSLSLATPQRSNNNNIKSLLKESKYNNSNSIIDDRPKTSRGKAMPSPDEFTSYVVPSPPKVKVKNNDDIESFDLNRPSYFDENNNYPSFKNAIWSDDDNNDDDNDIRYGSYDSDDDDDDDDYSDDDDYDDYDFGENLDDDEDEDEYIMKHRSANYNTNNTNAFSTSFRHSNQDDFMKYLSNDSNRNQESINWKFDRSDRGYSPDLKDTDSDASDDDEYYGGSTDRSTDQSTKDSDNNEWWNFRADGIATLSDDGNPILEDDRMIALGCWLFGSALKA